MDKWTRGGRGQEARRGEYLEAANGCVMRVALQHDLDVLDRLLADRPRTGHFVSDLLSGFFQLQTNQPGNI